MSQRPQQRAGRRYSQSGTFDGVSNERKIAPEAPRFLRHFYVLYFTMNTDK